MQLLIVCCDHTAKPKVIMTGDERVQGAETYALKRRVDNALKEVLRESGHKVERVFVASRTGREVPMTPGRDVSLEKVSILLPQNNYSQVWGRLPGSSITQS